MMMLPFVGASSLALAQNDTAARRQLGIEQLPLVIAANQDLGAQGISDPLPVMLIYRDNPRVAEQLRQTLLKTVTAIRDRQIEVRSLSIEELLVENPPSLSSVFIAEPLDARLDDVIRFAENNRLLLYSPFKGDVERGVTAGFKVTHKVLPMVNIKALERAGIQLKAFFLRIAVKHE